MVWARAGSRRQKSRYPECHQPGRRDEYVQVRSAAEGLFLLAACGDPNRERLDATYYFVIIVARETIGSVASPKMRYSFTYPK